jgi:hypothetical protein
VQISTVSVSARRVLMNIFTQKGGLARCADGLHVWKLNLNVIFLPKELSNLSNGFFG